VGGGKKNECREERANRLAGGSGAGVYAGEGGEKDHQKKRKSTREKINIARKKIKPKSRRNPKPEERRGRGGGACEKNQGTPCPTRSKRIPLPKEKRKYGNKKKKGGAEKRGKKKKGGVRTRCFRKKGKKKRKLMRGGCTAQVQRGARDPPFGIWGAKKKGSLPA